MAARPSTATPPLDWPNDLNGGLKPVEPPAPLFAQGSAIDVSSNALAGKLDTEDER